MQKTEFIVVIGTVQSYLAKWGEKLNFDNSVAEIAKKYIMSRERENWISVMRLSKFLSCLYCQACSWSAQNAGECLKWKAIVALALLKMGEKKKKKNCGNQVSENGGGEKKDDTCTIFFTTNYRWLVVIGSNLNLILRLLFYPNNNNQ